MQKSVFFSEEKYVFIFVMFCLLNAKQLNNFRAPKFVRNMYSRNFIPFNEETFRQSHW